MMSFVKTDDAMKELKTVIAQYFAKKAKQEMEEMWATVEMNDEKFETFRNLHERTPDKKAIHAEPLVSTKNI